MSLDPDKDYIIGGKEQASEKSTRYECFHCGGDCWISDATMARHEDKDYATVCVVCMAVYGPDAEEIVMGDGFEEGIQLASEQTGLPVWYLRGAFIRYVNRLKDQARESSGEMN